MVLSKGKTTQVERSFRDIHVKVTRTVMEETKYNLPSVSTYDETFVHPFVSLEGHEEWFRDDEKSLSKDFIIDLFNKLEIESSTEESKWVEEKLDCSDVKAWCSMSGTHLNSEVPCVRIDWKYNKPITIDHFIKGLYDRNSRLKWDDKIADIIEIKNEHPNMSILLTRNSKILFFDARQFIDKRIIFKCYEECNNPESVSPTSSLNLF